ARVPLSLSLIRVFLHHLSLHLFFGSSMRLFASEASKVSWIVEVKFTRISAGQHHFVLAAVAEHLVAFGYASFDYLTIADQEHTIAFVTVSKAVMTLHGFGYNYCEGDDEWQCLYCIIDLRIQVKAYITDASGTVSLTFLTPAADKIISRSYKELVEKYKPANPKKIPAEILAIEGKTSVFQLHYNTIGHITELTLDDIFNINTAGAGMSNSAE
ncbi:DNA helicase, partial [Tanacetum coccineum]